MPVLENRQESAPFGCGLWIMPDGEAVVYLSGNLDAGSAEAAFRYVSGVIDRRGGPVVVDLSGVVYCDAHGLKALRRMRRYAGQPRDRFQLASPSDQLISVMRATGLRVKFSS